MASAFKSMAVDLGKAALQAKANGDLSSNEPGSLRRAATNIGMSALQSRVGGGDSDGPNSFRRAATNISITAFQAKADADYDDPNSPREPVSFRRAATMAAADQATSLGKAAGKKWLNAYIAVPRLISRALQVIFALVVMGVYGKQLSEGMSPEFLFAAFIGLLSALVAFFFSFSSLLACINGNLEPYKIWWVDCILSLLWVAVFGIFAMIFLKRTDEEGDYKGASTGSMKAMVWVDLVCAALWLGTGVFGAMRKMASNKANKLGEVALQRVMTRKNTRDDGFEEV
jgi:hypothetical protein